MQLSEKGLLRCKYCVELCCLRTFFSLKLLSFFQYKNCHLETASVLLSAFAWTFEVFMFCIFYMLELSPFSVSPFSSFRQSFHEFKILMSVLEKLLYTSLLAKVVWTTSKTLMHQSSQNILLKFHVQRILQAALGFSYKVFHAYMNFPNFN